MVVPAGRYGFTRCVLCERPFERRSANHLYCSLRCVRHLPRPRTAATAEQAREWSAAYRAGMSLSDIARRDGVTRQRVHYVVMRQYGEELNADEQLAVESSVTDEARCGVQGDPAPADLLRRTGEPVGS